MIYLYLVFLQISFVISTEDFSTVSRGINQPQACRTERRMNLLVDQYELDTCARCYNYMPTTAFHVKFRYRGWKGQLRNPITNKTYEANPSNTSKALRDSFVDASWRLKWVMCCFAAIDCCNRMLEMPPPEGDGVYCPRTWDGWQCWDDTPAGTTARQTCQPYIYFETKPPSCDKYTYKVCWPNGTWFRDANSREWTNYTKCGRSDENRRFLYFHIATYAISVVTLIPALIIFSVYKQLQVYRITMHKHFFFSLFLNGIVVLLFKSIVILDEFNASSPEYETIMRRNGGLCKVLFILTKYFRMTNYMWMFCEGFYLHKLIAAAFAEQKSLIMFYIIGWAVPIFPVSIYAILRKTLEDDKCWAFPVEKFEWIMNAPNMLSLFVNFFFLCNIIRVLITKLRASNSNEPNHYRKAVRATIILVPLFGLQFFLVIYRPRSGHCKLLEIYTYFSHAIDGLQGFTVALFFCYMNGEVIYLIKRSYQRFRLSYFFQPQNSIMLNPVSVTQVSSMNDNQTASQQGLHYRTKKGDKKGDVHAVASITSGNSQENTTTV